MQKCIYVSKDTKSRQGKSTRCRQMGLSTAREFQTVQTLTSGTNCDEAEAPSESVRAYRQVSPVPTFRRGQMGLTDMKRKLLAKDVKAYRQVNTQTTLS